MTKRQKIRSGIILFSFFLFPALFYYLSPVLILRASSEGIINGSWILFLILFCSALLLGRGFCGWLCPAAGCQESIFAAQNKTVRRGNILKWIIWIPWIIAIIWLTFRAGGYHRIDFFYQTKYGLSISDLQSSIAYFCVLLLLIVLPAFTIGKRSFCHHLCWMAPFMILGRKLGRFLRLPALKLHADTENCIQCHSCSKHCPMSLAVEAFVEKGHLENTECILCGTCVDICPKRVISFAIGKQ